MKRTLAIVCALMLIFGLCASATAEIVGRAGDDYIHRYLAPNGQELFFVAMEQEPSVTFDDVNLDGVEDIVVLVTMGTSNFYVEFFVWDGEKYVMAEYEGNSLPNYTVTPSGYVTTHGNNGFAGALFEERIYAWEGTRLRLARSLISETDETTEYHDNGYTVTWNDAVLHITLREYTRTEEEWSDEILWEEKINLDDLFPDVYDALESRLWDGLTE